MENKSSE